MHICLDHDVHATDTIELDFLVLVLTPVAHPCHVLAVRLVLLVA